MTDTGSPMTMPAGNILKFRLDAQTTIAPEERYLTFRVDMPEGSRVLHVDSQYNIPTLWALCPVRLTPLVIRHFRLYPTGESVPEGLLFLGTAILHGGTLVLHCFEEPQGG